MNTVDYLRISLIDRCNFQCLYCMPEGEKLDYILKQDLLTDDELLLLLRDVLIPSGFTRFRLTGGEPLLRPNIVQLVQQFSQLPHLQDLSLSTNAFLLADLARPLYEAGLQRVNISLDSLDPQIFGKIIGDASSHLANSRSQTRWTQVWRGIQVAHEVGFDPLKLNVVVNPGVNDHEVLELAALTLDRCWHVRFIEFMPIGNGSLFGDRGWLPSEEIRQQIRDRWGLQEGQVVGNGPADIFQIPGAKGTLGFISQMSECFCDRCNRMRLSADGWLRPCLLNEEGQLDLKTELRRGVSTAELRHRVQLLLQQKPEINYKQRESGTITGAYSRTMSQIGG